MKKYKILNLYACLGGNRYKWDEVAKEKGIKIEVTAVEYDAEIAELYQERFPNDKVIVTDAHQYLLDNYKEFDFIWSSPPCPSHSRMNISQYTRESWKPKFPDFKLYEEVVFLDSYFKGKYVVENVIPYYEPLIPAKKRHRHLYWTNFNLPNILSERISPDWSRIKNEAEAWNEFHDYDFKKYKGKAYREIGRNLVDYEAGRKIFETLLGIERNSKVNQVSIFDAIT